MIFKITNTHFNANANSSLDGLTSSQNYLAFLFPARNVQCNGLTEDAEAPYSFSR